MILTGAEIGRREFKVIEQGVCYQLTAPGVDVVLELDRCSWHKHDLYGELTVRCAIQGTQGIDGVLSVASFNASNARARIERATQLQQQSRAPEIPWAMLIEHLCQATLNAERTGDPAVALRDIARADPSSQHVRVFGFNLPLRHPSAIFGDGGGGKSMLGLKIAGDLSIQGYRAALFDWELSGEDHSDRYWKIFGESRPSRSSTSSARGR